MQNLTTPQVLAMPFADQGQKNTIPVNATGTNAASLSEGFPEITRKTRADGGLPPKGLDFNGLGYLLTSLFFNLQNGGRYTFNQDVSDAIGGYPQDAVLTYTDTVNDLVYLVRSKIANNTYNFVTNPEYIDGIKWEKTYNDDLSGAISNVVSTDLTASRALVTDTNGKIAASSTITTTELGYLNNVSSNIQTQLNGKQATITGAATSIASNNLTASRAVISNSSGKVAVSATTSTELGYVHGVTSAIQNQIDGKLSATGSKSQNGYIKFSNGIIIQWGKGGTGTDTVVDLPTSFTNTNYSVTITSIGNAGVYQRTIATTGKTTGSFKTYAGGGTANDEFYWQAIGY